MSLAERIDALPPEPGVYLWKDARGRVLYVGKAKNLRARVRQYLSGHDGRVMVPYLVRASADVEVTVVRTEKEALILESSLIKKYHPRYNTRLVDDSSFLHLKLDLSAAWPRYVLVRGTDTKGKKTRFFGPYPSAARGRATLEFLSRRFPLRTCTDKELAARKRPCLLHQMHRCLAPCVDLCTPEDYAEAVQQSVLFLDGRSSELVERLGEQMVARAEAEDFEEAARLRDLIRALQASTERQQAHDLTAGDRDVWGLYREGDRGVLTVIPVRQGRMQEAMSLPFADLVGEDGDLLSSVLNGWYDHGLHVPAEILLPVAPSDLDALAEVLSERRREGGAVRLRVPQRGDKTRLVELAAGNARSFFERRTAEADRAERALAELARVCRLPGPPRRIECYDNSNIQGRDPVASQVVFVEGKPSRADYRRYKVKTVEGADDYATMREILGRRLRRAVQEASFPDLIVVDGGKGQLNAALAVLEDLGLGHLKVIGLAKPRTERARGDRETPDKIVLPGVKNPLQLRANSPALNLLQHIRDESHRTAVRYHRKVRSARNLTSSIEALPGVGPKRSRALLKHFGSVRALRRATADDIAALPGFGPALAERVVAALVADEG